MRLSTKFNERNRDTVAAHGMERKWGKSGGQEHEVVAVETSRVTVPLRPIAGYYFRTAVARPHGEQLTSLSRSTTKAARYYLFSLAKVLWSWRDTSREWRTEPDEPFPGCERLLTYFFHPLLTEFKGLLNGPLNFEQWSAWFSIN